MSRPALWLAGILATVFVAVLLAPAGASANKLEDVSCTSESFCAAVGTSDQPASSAQARMWNGDEWSSEWLPKPEDAASTALSGVFCASAEKCLAVGSYEDTEGATHGLALRWQGGHWSLLEVPSSEGVDIELSGVTCHSYPTCIAVGHWTVEGTTGGLAMAWDGETWTATATPIPSGATAGELTDLSCASGTSCVAVGTYTTSSEATKALSVSWDGSEWSEIETPSPEGATQSELADIACQASGACTAVGSYLAADGTRRTLAMSRTSSWMIGTTGPVQGSTESMLSGLVCPTASLCVAVGSAEIDGNQQPLTQRWEEDSWAEPEASGPPFASHGSRLSAISCLESGHCTSVGSVNYTDYTPPENLAYALRGEDIVLTDWGKGFARSWTRKRITPSTSALTDVACAESTCIEVGHHTDASGAKHAQATTWSSSSEDPPANVAVPEPGGASSSEISGVSCLSASSCVGVGSHVEGGTTKTLALSWNGSAWSVVSSPNPSGAAASRLNGVSCVSSSVCLALGSYVSGGVKKTLALRWNGSAWSIVTSPNPAGALSSQLADLSCASSTNCIGVGHYTDSAGVQKTLAVSWNDATQAWGVVSSPNPGGAQTSHLADVSCSSSSSCFAVGVWSDEDDIQTAFALRWNGSEWSTASLPLPSGASSSRLSGVVCPTGSDCTAIGTFTEGSEELALALQWNGTAWSHSAVDSPDGASATRPVAISCSGGSCHASGSVLYPGFRARNLAYHFDGTGWDVIEQGGLGGELRGISCVAGEEEEGECVGTGELRLNPTQGDGTRSPVNWQLSEEQWSAFPATTAGDRWADVSCTAPDECMVVGAAAGSPLTTRALHWNGTSWANTSPQNKSEAPSNFLEGVSCSTASRCVAVGYYRPDNTTPEKLLPLAQRWNGTSWTLQTAPAPTVSGTSRAKLADVSCTAADFCVAVGSYEDGGQSHGLIERWNGSSWTLATIAAPAESNDFGLTGVSCTSKSRCVAVGSYEGSESQHGYLTEWNGVSWSATSHPAPGSSYLSDVACISGSECVAVGSHAIGWNGSEWSAEPIAKPAEGGGYRLNSVSCDGAGGCVASGYQFALDAPEIREPLALVAFGEPESVIEDLPAEEDPEVEFPERNWSAEEIWPSTSELIDVACPSSTNCVGVGKYTDMDGEVETETLSWNGTSWSERAVPTPSGATESTLEGVSCTSTSSCVAVGSYLNAEEVTKTLAMAWNGTAWSIVSSPNPSGAEISKLADVHCVSSSFCIAAGGFLDPSDDKGKPLVLKWTGSEWQNISAPSPGSALGSELAGVWCTSTTACVAVGMTVNEEGRRRTLALQLSGSSWSLLGPPSPVGDSRLADVHCTSATACVAVGDHLLSSGVAKTLAMRWNGESWASDDTPSPGSYLSSLSSISCASASQCNAVGRSSDGSSEEPLALEWEGGSWSVREAEPLSAESDADVFRASLGGIACVSASQCMSVGAVETQNSGSPESEEQPDRNLAFSFDGTDWDLAQFAGPPVSSIGGVSCPASAPTDCMAVGRSDDLADAHGAVDTAWKLEEGKWDPLPMPGDVWNSLSDLSCSAADKCTTVGSSDAGQFVVARWNGTAWATQSPPTPGTGYDHELSGVSCSTATSCIAVGGSKTSSEVSVPRAISWNGTSWSSMTIAAPSGAESTTLGDVACTSASACTAVGEYRDSEDEVHAFVQRWNGSSWTTTLITDPFEAIEASLSGVTCLSTTDCTAVGSYKLSEAEESRRSFVVRWNGTAWTAQTVPHPEEGSAGRTELRDVSCVSSTECVAVGETTAGESDYSLVMGWDGTQWSVEAGFLPNGTATPQLTSVSCGTGDGCVAGGWSHDGTEALVARAGSDFEDEVAPFARVSTYVAGGPSAEISKAVKCREKGFKGLKGKYGLKNETYGYGWEAWTMTDWCYGKGHVYWHDSSKHKKNHPGSVVDKPTKVHLNWSVDKCNNFNGYWNHNCLIRLQVTAISVECGILHCDSEVDVQCLHTRIYGSEGTRAKPNHNLAVTHDACPGETRALPSWNTPEPPSDDEPPEIEEPPPAPTPPPIDPAKDGDVNGDDKADLVTLHTSGDVHTLNGVNAADKVTTGMDSALFRGSNHHVVDVADVDADGYSDLVSLCFVNQVCVRRGKSDNSFDTGMVVRTDVVSGTRNAKGHEPIGVADVTGDLRGDLVTFYAPEGNFYVYPGEEHGLFGTGMTLGGGNINSALFDRRGLYFLDVADVNGDEYADVVALNTSGDAEVYPGTETGVQQASTQVNPAVDPIMADGIGHEPIGVGDVNGDGKADLATLTPDGQVAVYAGTSEKVAPDNHLRYLKVDPVLSHSALDSSLTDEVGDDFVGLMDRTGDGKVDLVKVTSEGAVSIAPGQSDLKFGEFASFASGINPSRFAKVGYEQAFAKPFIRRIGCSPQGCTDRPLPIESDVDGDLRADLVTLESAKNALHVYRAMGERGHEVSAGPGVPPYDTPNFMANSALFDGLGHHVIDVADVTGDWHAETVTLHDNGSVYVFPANSNGNATFGPGTASLAGSMTPGPYSASGYEPIAVADVTGDAIGDLVVFKPGQGVKLYPGETNGTFGAPITSLSTANSARFDQTGYHFLDVVDVTGDRRGDLVAASAEDDEIVVFKGNANGGFVSDGLSDLSLRLDEGPGQELIGLGDVNGDRRADLATLVAGTVNVYEGQASGGFATEKAGSLSPAGTSFAGSMDSNLFDQAGDEIVGLLDENGDRKADLVAVRSDGSARIYRGRADFTFNTSPTVRDLSGFTSVRFNKPSGHEVVNEKPPVLRAGCTKSDCPWPPIQFRKTESDVDGDYRGDLVTVGADGEAHVFAGHRTGLASQPVGSLSGQLDPALLDGKGHYVIDVADVNDDDNSDLITVKDDGDVLVHLGTEERTFEAALDTGISLPPSMNGAADNEPIAVADVTGDGFDDLVSYIGHSGTYSVGVYKGQADGKFNSTAVQSITTTFFYSGLKGGLLDAVDVNGDGLADLVTILGSYLYVYPGQSSGQFASPVFTSSFDSSLLDGSGQEPVGLGDVDGDGKADLLTTNGALKLYKGQADGKFATPVTAYGSVDSALFDGTGEEFLGLLDYDADGRADLVSVSSAGEVHTYRAQADGTFEAPQANSGELETVRHQNANHEVALQRPFVRRPGCRPQPMGCPWPPDLPADSDVDGDGRSDLVTLHSSGTAHVFKGTASGLDTEASAQSFGGTKDSALRDGSGDYVIDVARVDSDPYADLVTIDDDGDLFTHSGGADGKFATGVERELNLPPSINGAGDVEPIGVANADGIPGGALVVYRDPGIIETYVNDPYTGWFSPYPNVDEVSGLNSALLDGTGSYLLDVIDVNGDGVDDLVTVTSYSKIVLYKGKPNEFGDPEIVGDFDPVMDDGTGEEPIGLADMTGDGKADLLSLDESGVLKLRSGSYTAGLTCCQTPFEGTVDSSLLDGEGEDLIGLLDHDNDDLADLVSIDDEAQVRVYEAQFGGALGAPEVQEGAVTSLRHEEPGHEFATQRPFLRKTECSSEGCGESGGGDHPYLPHGDADSGHWVDADVLLTEETGEYFPECQLVEEAGCLSTGRSEDWEMNIFSNGVTPYFKPAIGPCTVDFEGQLEYESPVNAETVELDNACDWEALDTPWPTEVCAYRDGGGDWEFWGRQDFNLKLDAMAPQFDKAWFGRFSGSEDAEEMSASSLVFAEARAPWLKSESGTVDLGLDATVALTPSLRLGSVDSPPGPCSWPELE